MEFQFCDQTGHRSLLHRFRIPNYDLERFMKTSAIPKEEMFTDLRAKFDSSETGEMIDPGIRADLNI